MQWRMLARRCPSGSMTLVGDFGQASRTGALVELGRRAHERHRAGAAAPRDAHRELPHSEPRSWRSRTGSCPPPRPASSRPARSAARAPSPMVETVGSGDLVAAAAGPSVRDALAIGGTVAVIAPLDLHAPLTDALRDRGAVADSVEAIDAPIAVLSPLDAKGLEFDHVIVVEPAQLVSPDAAGAAPAVRRAHTRDAAPGGRARRAPAGSARSRPCRGSRASLRDMTLAQSRPHRCRCRMGHRAARRRRGRRRRRRTLRRSRNPCARPGEVPGARRRARRRRAWRR